MNIHDIELPPLPKPEGQHFSHKNTYSMPQMHHFARAAIEPYTKRIVGLESQLEAIGAGGVTQGQRLIEADRQCRSEPVGYLVDLGGRDTYVSADRTVRDAHLTYGWRPVYAAPQPAESVELQGVSESLSSGDGFWRSCTGCHETNEGYDTGPYSKTLRCHLGNGCRECGGIGAVWDDTDYDAMADYMARSMGYQQPAESVKCLDPSMGEHACSNRAQCWEPCGELGSSVEHAKVAEPVKHDLYKGAIKERQSKY